MFLMTAFRNIWGLYVEFRDRFCGLVIYVLLFSFLAIAINFFGWMWINTLIGCFLPIFAIYQLSNPVLMTGAIGVGAAAKPKDRLAGSIDALKTWKAFVTFSLLYLSIFFLVAGTVQFERNWRAVPAVYLALFAMFMVNAAWGMKMAISRKIVYSYIVVIFIIKLGSLISGAAYAKVFGFDPYAVCRVTAVDVVLYDINQLQEQNAERQLAKQLTSLKEKLANGQPLTGEEILVLTRAQSESTSKTIPARISAATKGATTAVSGLWSSPKSEKQVVQARTVTTRRVSGVPAWAISVVDEGGIKLGHVYTGDKFEYKSSQPFFVFYLSNDESDKGKLWPFPASNGTDAKFCFITDAPPDGADIFVSSGKGIKSFQIKYRIFRAE